MTYLDERWFERGFAAVLESLNFDADTRKRAIQFLFDEGFWDPEKLSWAAAEGRFRDCCNRTKTDAIWKPAELWALMKRFGRHDFAIAMVEDLGYEVRKRATEERRQDLIERALRALESNEATAAALTAELARLNDGEVHARGVALGRKWLLTSVRRSITNLADESVGVLVHLKGQSIEGPHGRPEGLWQIARGPR